MAAPARSQPLQPGDRAPSVALEAINREGKVSTDQFRGEKPVLVGMYRGLSCPFCRRHMMLMAELDGELKAKGIETLTIVNTPVERARMYLRYRPMKNLLAADPERLSHQAFGVPSVVKTPETMAMVGKVMINPMKELPAPRPFAEVVAETYKNDTYETSPEEVELDNKVAQMVGQFLLDRDGVVRWSFIEAANGMETLLQYPDAKQVMSAAAVVAR